MFSRNLEIFDEGIVACAHIRLAPQSYRQFCNDEVQRRQANFVPIPKEVASTPNETLSNFSSKPYELSSSLASPPKPFIPDLSAGAIPDACAQFWIASAFTAQFQTVTNNSLKRKSESGTYL
jgi:hypothetical protein